MPMDKNKVPSTNGCRYMYDSFLDFKIFNRSAAAQF